MPRNPSKDPQLRTPLPHLVASDPSHERASMLIIISAQALGSAGYALSLLVIWLSWIIPLAPAPPQPLLPPTPSPSNPTKPTRGKKTQKASLADRKPSLPSPNHRPPGAQQRRASAPVDITPILHAGTDPLVTHNRHVFFADQKADPAIQRRNTMPTHPTNLRIDSTVPVVPDSLTSSPLSTPNSLTTSTPTELEPPTAGDHACEKGAESDSSRQSLFKRSTLPKLKLAFGKSRKAAQDDKSSDNSVTESLQTEKSARRASGGFGTPWLYKSKPSPEPTADPVPASSPAMRSCFANRPSPPSRPSTPSLFSRKSQRRDLSTPIPRTSPYGAPYFATPPSVPGGTSYPEYLKSLPQFEQDVSQTSDSDASAKQGGRGRRIKRVSLDVPNGGRIHKRRSASEDWAHKPVPRS